MLYREYLGNYPNGKETAWSNKCQGVTHDVRAVWNEANGRISVQANYGVRDQDGSLDWLTYRVIVEV